MNDKKDIKPQKSALFFALILFSWAGQAFTFQDIGRKSYGEYVTGGQAILCGVIMIAISTWSTALFFHRSKAQGSSIRWPLAGFIILLLCTMVLQAALYFGGASLYASNLSVLLSLLIGWPFINTIVTSVGKKTAPPFP